MQVDALAYSTTQPKTIAVLNVDTKQTIGSFYRCFATMTPVVVRLVPGGFREIFGTSANICTGLIALFIGANVAFGVVVAVIAEQPMSDSPDWCYLFNLLLFGRHMNGDAIYPKIQ